MSKPEIVVTSAVRTPIGKFGGALSTVPLADLAAHVVRHAVERSNLDAFTVGHVVMGNVIPTEPRDLYLARVAAIRAGLSSATCAMNVNRLCGSGLQAITTAAELIQSGQCFAAVAGGVESMSRAPYWLGSMRWGSKINDAVAVDAMVGAITDPFTDEHMGALTDQLAERFGISRERQDLYAANSHRRALDAIHFGRFASQIVPVEVGNKRGTETVTEDEQPRSDTTFETLAKLRPAFSPNGTVTAGNASGLNDGAAALALMDRAAAERRQITPLARLVSYAVTGIEPEMMGMAPIDAILGVCMKSGLTVADFDVIEVNEAFAGQFLVLKERLPLPHETNPNGGAIALGHPIGATGAILTVKALHELKRIGGRYALVSLCIGGGQGIAAIFENLR
jgi:acetyl-CoA C-acetyltransferase